MSSPGLKWKSNGAAGHRVDFERERERCDTLVAEAPKLGNLAISAREKAARLDGELSARPRWWGWQCPNHPFCGALAGKDLDARPPERISKRGTPSSEPLLTGWTWSIFRHSRCFSTAPSCLDSNSCLFWTVV